jgi:hypothetical protein
MHVVDENRLRLGNGRTDQTVTAGNTYSYRITSINSAGSSAASVAATMTTPSTPAAIPTDNLRVWLKADAGMVVDANNLISRWRDRRLHSWVADHACA